MNRRQLLGTLAAGAVVGVAGCETDDVPAIPPAETETESQQPPTETQTPSAQTPMTPQPALDNGSFEDGLTGWTVGRDLPTDPNAAGDQPVASDVSVSTDHAVDGAHSCALFLDGRQDDGTLWVQQRAALDDADRLAVDYYSEQESFNIITKAAAYAGPDPGRVLTESDFDTSAAIEDHAGWKTYECDISHDGIGLVAVGISVVWETELTRFLDNVRLQ